MYFAKKTISAFLVSPEFSRKSAESFCGIYKKQRDGYLHFFHNAVFLLSVPKASAKPECETLVTIVLEREWISE